MSLSRIPRHILADAGFWIGLSDSRDGQHRTSHAIYERLRHFRVLAPWPVLYEVLRTKSVKRPSTLESLEQGLKSLGVELLPDEKYREGALSVVWARRGNRNLSLVDVVLRMVVEDADIRVDGLVTYNPGDFADSCRKRGVVMIQRAEELSSFDSR